MSMHHVPANELDAHITTTACPCQPRKISAMHKGRHRTAVLHFRAPKARPAPIAQEQELALSRR